MVVAALHTIYIMKSCMYDKFRSNYLYTLDASYATKSHTFNDNKETYLF